MRTIIGLSIVLIGVLALSFFGNIYDAIVTEIVITILVGITGLLIQVQDKQHQYIVPVWFFYVTFVIWCLHSIYFFKTLYL